MDDPLLIDGKKFDLRIYVMVTQIGSYPAKKTVAFLAEEGLVRLCTEDYVKPNKSNFHKLLSHLTNFSLNKNSENYTNAEFLDQEELEMASKRPLSSVLQTLAEESKIDSDLIME